MTIELIWAQETSITLHFGSDLKWLKHLNTVVGPRSQHPKKIYSHSYMLLSSLLLWYHSTESYSAMISFVIAGMLVKGKLMAQNQYFWYNKPFIIIYPHPPLKRYTFWKTWVLIYQSRFFRIFVKTFTT